MEKIWLAANKCGVSVHPLTAPLLMFNILDHGAGNEFDDYQADLLKDYKYRFARLFAMNNQETGIMLFRFFISEDPGKYSIRKPLKEILHFDS